MAKYKVGDKVLVKEGLDDDTQYYMEDKCDYWYAEQDMIDSGGKVVTINEVEEHGRYYKCDGFSPLDYWTDEMFVGLAEETPSTYKVGDRVKIVGARNDNKAKHIGKVFTIRQLNPNGEYGMKELHYGLVEDGGNTFVWFPNELQLYTEPEPKEPTPAPIQVNVNVTVNINYDNACWYCRKGGLVDTYFAGKPGICPHCGRVCNAVAQSTQCYKPVEPVKEVKKENKPLTTEELEALPDGTRVFTVWLTNGTEDWSSKKTCWRTKKDSKLYRANGNYTGISFNGKTNRAYLEEPKRPEPELPF